MEAPEKLKETAYAVALDVGKTHHIFHLPGGRNIHSSYLHKRLYAMPGIRTFQIRHRALGWVWARVAGQRL